MTPTALAFLDRVLARIPDYDPPTKAYIRTLCVRAPDRTDALLTTRTRFECAPRRRALASMADTEAYEELTFYLFYLASDLPNTVAVLIHTALQLVTAGFQPPNERN